MAGAAALSRKKKGADDASRIINALEFAS